MKLPLFPAIYIFHIIILFTNSCHFFQPDPIVLQINSRTWTHKEFSHLLAIKINNLPITGINTQNNSINNLKELLTQDLIIEEIIRSWANEHNIIVSQQQLQTHLQIFKNDFPNVNTFKLHLKKKKISENQWKENIRKKLLAEKVMNQISASLSQPSLKEIKSYYKTHKNQFKRKEQVLVRQILHQEKDVIQQIQQRLQGGEDFQALAKKFSQNPSRGKKEWINKGTLKVFDTAFSLKKGQFSQILTSPYGFHLLQILDHRPAKTISLNEAKKQIQESLYMIRQKAIFANWLDKQSKKVHILKNQQLIDKIKVKIL